MKPMTPMTPMTDRRDNRLVWARCRSVLIRGVCYNPPAGPELVTMTRWLSGILP